MLVRRMQAACRGTASPGYLRHGSIVRAPYPLGPFRGTSGGSSTRRDATAPRRRHRGQRSLKRVVVRELPPIPAQLAWIRRRSTAANTRSVLVAVAIRFGPGRSGSPREAKTPNIRGIAAYRPRYPSSTRQRAKLLSDQLAIAPLAWRSRLHALGRSPRTAGLGVCGDIVRGSGSRQAGTVELRGGACWRG